VHQLDNIAFWYCWCTV